MKLITKKIKAASAYERWMKQYPKDKDGIGIALLALGNNPSVEDVNKITGNNSWTDLVECSECENGDADIIIQVGEQPYYESNTAWLCENCIKKAYDLLKKELRRNK